MKPFSDPQAVAQYAEVPRRAVPGFPDLHRMVGILLAECAPIDARILVLGAGGGLELAAFAQAQAGWTFDGVDPAPAMLRLAERTLEPFGSRIRLHEGYIDIAPEGPFDAATCLLNLHFVDPEERRRTLAEVHRRLKPGAPFVVVHFSIPQSEGARAIWLNRYAAFQVTSGTAPDKAEAARSAVDAHLEILTPVNLILIHNIQINMLY